MPARVMCGCRTIRRGQARRNPGGGRRALGFTRALVVVVVGCLAVAVPSALVPPPGARSVETVAFHRSLPSFIPDDGDGGGGPVPRPSPGPHITPDDDVASAQAAQGPVKKRQISPEGTDPVPTPVVSAPDPAAAVAKPADPAPKVDPGAPTVAPAGPSPGPSATKLKKEEHESAAAQHVQSGPPPAGAGGVAHPDCLGWSCPTGSAPSSGGGTEERCWGVACLGDLSPRKTQIPSGVPGSAAPRGPWVLGQPAAPGGPWVLEQPAAPGGPRALGQPPSDTPGRSVNTDGPAGEQPPKPRKGIGTDSRPANGPVTPNPEAYPDLKRVKGKQPVQGGGGMRKRWVDNEGNIWEDDRKSQTLEKYNPKGKHLGEYDPDDRRQVGGPVKGRTTPI